MKLAAKRPLGGIVLLVLAIAVQLAFCLSLRYDFLNPLFYITTHAKGQGGCFFGFYQAGVNLLNGESIYGCEGYSPPASVAVPFYHHYRYLPFCSYITSVVSTFLRPWPAYWTWIAINEALLAACIVLTLRLRNRYGNATIVASALWLLYSPMYIELYMGQVCFSMAFFIFLMLYPSLKGAAGGRGFQRNTTASNIESEGIAPAGKGVGGCSVALDEAGVYRHAAPLSVIDSTMPRVSDMHFRWLQGLSWIVTLLLKGFTAIYTLTLIRMGKKKMVVAGIVAIIATSAPYFLKRPQDLKWFLHINFQPLPAYPMGGYFGFSVLLKDIFDHIPRLMNGGRIDLGLLDLYMKSIPLLAILGGIVLMPLLLTVRRKTIDPLGSITLWTLTFFLIFKDIWEYHYVILVPLFVGLYLETRSKYLLALFAMLAIPTPFLLYDIPASNNPQAYWSAPLSIMHHSFKALPTFLFYIWIVRRELRSIGGLRSLLSPTRAVTVEF
jgi:hypothetical protein